MRKGFGSHFSEHNILQIQEWARGVGDQEPAVICIFFTDAAQQARPIVGKFKGLVAEGGPEDGAVAAFKVTDFGVSARYDMMEMIADEW